VADAADSRYQFVTSGARLLPYGSLDMNATALVREAFPDLVLPPTMPPSWQARDIQLILPLERARAIWQRAGESIGFDAHGDQVDVSSHEHGRVGCFRVWWHAPTESDATIFRVEWDSAKTGEPEMWGAIEQLAGGPLAL
jgi:hypothetical protein